MFLLLILTTLLVGTQQQSLSDSIGSYGYSSIFPSTFSQMSSSSPQSLNPSYSMGGINDFSLWSNPSGHQPYQSYWPTQQGQSDYIYNWLKNLYDGLKSQTQMYPNTQNSYVSNNYGLYPNAQSSYGFNNYGSYPTAQSMYIPNNYRMYPTAQSSYMSNTIGMSPTAQRNYLPNSYRKYSSGQSSYRPNNYGMYSNAQNNYISNNNEIMNPMISGYSSYYGYQSQTPYAHTHGPLAAPNPYNTRHYHKYNYGSDDYSMQLYGQNYPNNYKSLTTYSNHHPSKIYSSYSSQKPSYYSNNSPADANLYYFSDKSQYPSYSSYYSQIRPHIRFHLRPTVGYSKNDDYKSHSLGYNSYGPVRNYPSVNKYSNPSSHMYNSVPKNFGQHNYQVKNAHEIWEKHQDDTEYNDSAIKFPHIHILSSAALFKLLHPQNGNGFTSLKRITDNEEIAPKTKVMRFWILPKSFNQEMSSKMVKNRFEPKKEEANEAKESDISDNEGIEEVETEKVVAKPENIDNLKGKVTTTESAQKPTEKELVSNLDQKLARDSSNEINVKDNMINRDTVVVTRTDLKDVTQSTTIDMQHHVSSNVQIPEKNRETNVKDSSYKTPEQNPDSSLNGFVDISISTETPVSTSASSPITVIEH